MTRSRPDLEQWILQARQVEAWPSADAQARVWSSIERRIAYGPPPVQIGPVNVGTIAASKLTIVLAIVTSIGAPLLGGVAAATMADAPAEAAIPPAPIVARVEPPAPTHPPQIAVVRLPVAHEDGPVEMLAEEVDEGPVDVDVEIVALPEPGRRERALRRGSGSPGSTLAMETRILRGARAELRAGNLAEANALLARHRDRFPRGMLVDLRAALEIDAQCRLGHTARAHALAGAFERTYPGSPYRARATNCDPADGGQP